MEFPKCISVGFTLLELLLAVAITSILLTMVIPGFSGMLDQNRMVTNVNGFISSLHMARSEAVTRGLWVTVCPSSNGVSCVSDYRRWGEGYIVFVNRDKDKERDENEELLGWYQGFVDQMVVHTSSDSRNTIAYRPNGRAWGFNTTVRFCQTGDSSLNRAVIISATGRPRLSDNMPDGSAIICD
ncbi:MAG: prepilin-type N-terminal cleavage/methylation domain-containing protein [Gammaproteobacteria bacterium]|nr:prepilin-type N-terminal cleavage/methylation domain-containing protein [Gammaproteobacteria bacterium]